MAGRMTVGEYQLLFREINVVDEVPVDNKVLAYADEVSSAVCELLCK